MAIGHATPGRSNRGHIHKMKRVHKSASSLAEAERSDNPGRERSVVCLICRSVVPSEQMSW